MGDAKHESSAPTGARELSLEAWKWEPRCDGPRPRPFPYPSCAAVAHRQGPLAMAAVLQFYPPLPFKLRRYARVISRRRQEPEQGAVDEIGFVSIACQWCCCPSF
ncbi:unnamed protein product [Prorocentrum cordatum]|uniref:Uncharacterized protein n=1 Tax=Prorocentrum cordatum TaxID=2364126 RepID=A0ABN9WAH5_9DINO|nr:unnamed protein product [Polarella glacialis]